jgi:potassium efflux system protein
VIASRTACDNRFRLRSTSESARRRALVGLVAVLLLGPFRADSQSLVSPLSGPATESDTAVDDSSGQAAVLASDAAAATRPEASGNPTSIAEIEARRARVAADLQTLAGERPGAEAADVGHANELRRRLKKLEGLLARQADLAARTAPSDAKRSPDPETLPLDADDPDSAVSVLTLGSLYEARFASQQVLDRREEQRAALDKAIADATEHVESAEKRRRQARRDLESSRGGADPDARRALELRQLDSRIAQEELNVHALELAEARPDTGLQATLEAFDDSIRRMRERLAGEPGSTHADLTVLNQREADLQRHREDAGRRLATAELTLAAAEKRFARMNEPSPSLLEEIEALTARRDAIRQEILVIDSQILRLDEERQTWLRWDALLQSAEPPGQLPEWESLEAERINALKHDELERGARLSALRTRIEEVGNRLAELPPGARLRPVLEAKESGLEHLRSTLHADLTSLAIDRRRSERVLEDIEDRLGRIDLGEALRRALTTIRDVWNYEITSVDDSPITVGSVVLAVLFFAIGLWAARHGSRIVGRIASERFKLDVGGANALQTLSFYLLLVSFMLLALRAVHFPLTAFTVLGGAMAIGIGFGSQNVMNNFISGLILMLERPIRASDVVEVDGSHGAVEHIGARSTQIRSTDGRHIIVPNSFFLESNVVNWTLSDDLIRTRVSVGVMYGSPTRLVEELIQRVVTEEDQVIRNPAPIIIFEEFGDNSLNFDVFFWVRARSPMEVKKVQSRIRFGIDDAFREHDLVIAFPQRDVHLDSVSPIEVRVLGEG